MEVLPGDHQEPAGLDRARLDSAGTDHLSVRQDRAAVLLADGGDARGREEREVPHGGGDSHRLRRRSDPEELVEQRAGLGPQVGADPVRVVALLDQHKAGLAQDRQVVMRRRLREADLVGRFRE